MEEGFCADYSEPSRASAYLAGIHKRRQAARLPRAHGTRLRLRDSDELHIGHDIALLLNGMKIGTLCVIERESRIVHPSKALRRELTIETPSQQGGSHAADADEDGGCTDD